MANLRPMRCTYVIATHRKLSIQWALRETALYLAKIDAFIIFAYAARHK